MLTSTVNTSAAQVVGKPQKLLDGRDRVTGRTRFGGDIQLPGLLHIRLVLSPYAHARLERIDASRALQMPGVVAVLTADDLPPAARQPRSRAHAMLAHERVLFRGQPVAAVVAATEAQAMDAVDAVEVEYEMLDAAVDPLLAMAKGAPLVWPDGLPGESEELAAHGAAATGPAEAAPERSNIAATSHLTRGDAAQGFAEADVILERTYRTPIVYQAYVEPHVTLAEPSPLGDGLTVYTATQSVFGVRQTIAGALGIPETSIKIVPLTVGGAFGAKFAVFQPLVAAVALRLRRPVRLALTRSEDILASTPAPQSIVELKMGAKRDGRLTAMQARMIFDAGCFPGAPASIAALMLGGTYRLPHLAIETVEVLTHKPSVGAYRGPGATQSTLVLEQHMDDLAHQVGLDPIEFRLRNASDEGDPLPNGTPFPQIGLRTILQRLAEHPLWRDRGPAGSGRGVGVAVGGWLGGLEPAAAACKMDRDGSLVISVGSVDLNGTNTTMAAIAAETFGVPIEKVRVVTGDSDSAPYAGAAGGSKITYTVGLAVQRAAAEAKQQVLNIAAERLEASADDLEIVQGAVQVRGVPDRKVALKEIGEAFMRFGGVVEPVYGRGRSAQLERAPGFAGVLAEVEVDEATSETRVTRLVIAQDVGFAINPLTVEGQMHGGAAQGVGWGLYERLVYDAGGQLLTASLMDYTVPRAAQTPAMEAVIVEVPSPNGPFGARGVGEPPIIPPGAAVANAVRAATGVRVSELPVTPEALHRARQAAT
ncbi:MAG: xanthine dehydrogenase family protein [Anaerolineae bacterium]|nr:xanthine dehydrogenase family protein [Anaerolineae bacterium]